MFPYRELADGRRFRCAQCGRIKRVKYVPVSDLCRACAARNAAEKKRSIPNIPVSLADNLIVTKAIEIRLRKRAKRDVPPTRVEKLGDNVSKLSIIVFWGSAYFVAHAIFPEFSYFFWLTIIGWAFGIPYAVIWVIDRLLYKSRKERAERIAGRIAELAEQRRKAIEEALRFYQSPEWSAARKLKIKEDGPFCKECRKHIKDDIDITVDHIRPRSKFPELALDRTNLRVLCRSCNSKKGARWLD